MQTPKRKYPKIDRDRLEDMIMDIRQIMGLMEKHGPSGPSAIEKDRALFESLNGTLREQFKENGVPYSSVSWKDNLSDLEREWTVARLEEIGVEAVTHVRTIDDVYGPGPSHVLCPTINFLQSLVPLKPSAEERVAGKLESQVRAVVACVIKATEEIERFEEHAFADRIRMILENAGLLDEPDPRATIDVKA